MFQQSFTKNQALPKIKHYCAYQDRCHSEVKEKLYGFGLNKKEVEELMAQLIVEQYLDEERFALLFAGGKFRMKKWGKVKIRYELFKKQVSVYSIKKALASIDENDYKKTLERHAADKLKTIRAEKNIYIKKKKLQDYLLQKGFEADLVRTVVNKL